MPPLCGRVRRAANAWDRFYRYHEAPWRGERPLAPLRPWLRSPVLELGCGNGKLLRPLARDGLRVVGLDVSWHALRRLPHRDRVLGDAAALPFGDASFATVLDIHCAGHLPPAGRREAAREAARVLRPGGHLVVERLGPSDLRAGQGRPVEGDPAARALADGRTTWFADEDALVALFGAAGLVPCATEVGRRSLAARDGARLRESVRVVFRRPPAPA